MAKNVKLKTDEQVKNTYRGVVTDYRVLQKGDHILVWRFGALYAHHGIVCSVPRQKSIPDYLFKPMTLVISYSNLMYLSYLYKKWEKRRNMDVAELLIQISRKKRILKITCFVALIVCNALYSLIVLAKLRRLLKQRRTLSEQEILQERSGIKVIHFRRGEGIIETDLNEFLLSGTLRMVEYGIARFWHRQTALILFGGVKHKETSDSPDVVVERARRMKGGGHKKYHFLLNNCEHFAYYCKTGEPWSGQSGFAMDLFGKIARGRLDYPTYTLSRQKQKL